MTLQRICGALGWIFAPQDVDETLSRDGLTGPTGQREEQCLEVPAPNDSYSALVVDYLHDSEESNLHE